MRTLHRIAIALVTLCCILALPTAAAAQSSEGAEVHRLLGCEITPINSTICFEGRLVLNASETPSGMVSTIFVFYVHQVFADGPCVGSTIDESRVVRELRTVEGVRLSHTVFMLRNEITCGGTTVLQCAYFAVVHYANGQYVVERTRVECTEP